MASRGLHLSPPRSHQLAWGALRRLPSMYFLFHFPASPEDRRCRCRLNFFMFEVIPSKKRSSVELAVFSMHTPQGCSLLQRLLSLRVPAFEPRNGNVQSKSSNSKKNVPCSHFSLSLSETITIGSASHLGSNGVFLSWKVSRRICTKWNKRKWYKNCRQMFFRRYNSNK